MSYSQFTLSKAKEDFGLTYIENHSFLPNLDPISPSEQLSFFLKDSVPLAIAMGSEKARSELIIAPLLLEIWRSFDHKISFFSGEEFNVDADRGLTGVCDFLISRSPEQLFPEAPVAVLVEAKKEDLKSGLGQCIAEMVAAQYFNDRKNNPVQTIYGVVTSGNRWLFLQLEGQVVTLDLQEYSLFPVDKVLSILRWMVVSAMGQQTESGKATLKS
jgi:hypothetical protein